MSTLPLTTRFKETQIRGDKILQEIVRIDSRLDNIESEGFKLTDTFVAIGDSWVAGPPTPGVGNAFTDEIAEKTGTTIVSKGFGGQAINHLTSTPSIMTDLIKNTSFRNLSSIIHFGLNDFRNSSDVAFNKNLYQYQQCCVSAYLACSVPQDKIIDARDFSTKVGTWTNGAAHSFGLQTLIQNDYVETSATGRYYAFSFFITAGTIGQGNPNRWEVYIDNVLQTRQDIRYMVPGGTNNYYMLTFYFDMKTVASRVVRVVNVEANATGPHFFNYCMAWNGTETNQRNVLVITPPIFDFQSRGLVDEPQASTAMYLNITRGIKNAVSAVRKDLGLPVYLYENTGPSMGYDEDQLHLTIAGASKYADDIIENAITEIIDL